MTEAEDEGDTPGAAELKLLAEELIKDQSTMTLATSGDDGPWAASVYYVRHNAAF